MKASFSPKLVSVIAAVSITLFSCSKNSLNVPAGTSGNSGNTPAAPTVGTINDLGFSSSGTKIMYASFVIQDYTLESGDNISSGGEASLVLSFYSNDDGVIPAGTYTLDTTGKQEPFTFDFTSLNSPLDPSTTSNADIQAVAGTVTVSRNDSGYTFSASLVFNSGNTLTGYSSGKMLYTDTEVSGKK